MHCGRETRATTKHEFIWIVWVRNNYVNNVILSLNFNKWYYTKVKLELLSGNNTRIHCSADLLQPCSIVNENDVAVDMRAVNNYGQHIEPKIIIDSTAPSIESVYLHTKSPAHCLNPCNYTAGDQIICIVKFYLPMKISTSKPTITIKVQDEVSTEDHLGFNQISIIPLSTEWRYHHAPH